MLNPYECTTEGDNALKSGPEEQAEAVKRPSMRKAINQMCKNCIYDRASAGTWRQQTEGCTIKECPLFELRPKSSAHA